MTHTLFPCRARFSCFSLSLRVSIHRPVLSSFTVLPSGAPVHTHLECTISLIQSFPLTGIAIWPFLNLWFMCLYFKYYNIKNSVLDRMTMFSFPFPFFVLFLPPSPLFICYYSGMFTNVHIYLHICGKFRMISYSKRRKHMTSEVS